MQYSGSSKDKHEPHGSEEDTQRRRCQRRKQWQPDALPILDQSQESGSDKQNTGSIMDQEKQIAKDMGRKRGQGWGRRKSTGGAISSRLDEHPSTIDRDYKLI